MENKEIFKKDGATLLFMPSAITSFTTKELKDNLLSQLDNSTHLNINLENTTEFDIVGLQFIIAIKNYTIIHGLEFNISNYSEIIDTKLSILGVKL